jgi:hypothetical protein
MDRGFTVILTINPRALHRARKYLMPISDNENGSTYLHSHDVNKRKIKGNF